MRLGALEAGGTKMVCAIGNEQGEIFEQISIPTETPEITIPRIIEYFKDKSIDALGIACFGPVELNRKSEKYIRREVVEGYQAGWSCQSICGCH